MGKKHIPQRDANSLPAHIGEAFQRDLIHLVDELTLDAQEDVKCGIRRNAFKEEYLRSQLLSKYCDATTTPADVRRSSAIAKWLKTEERNAKTNDRLLFDDCDFGWTTSNRLDEIVRDIIRDVLGPLCYPDVFVTGRHTTGASTRVKRSAIADVQKYAGKAHVSATALPHWSNFVSYTKLEDQEVELVNESELFTVPKASEIDRVACKEPEVNMYLQRAIGNHIRKRLRQKGIDLNDQSINQNLARKALALGLATIDLSAASDSITEQLVVNWLPPEWFMLLNDLRVHSTKIDGKIHSLSMFSSMGNGFTFELESLLFWALTRAIARLSRVKGKISVYGDDIICPAVLGPRLQRVFAWYGFKLNSSKSNWTGGFRESCGKHYYRGWDVTPFYIRGPVRSQMDLIRLLNQLLVWSGHAYGFFTDERAAEFHRKWSQQVPHCLWGGQDPMDPAALVSGHAPRKRLKPKSKPLDFDQAAGFIAWLNDTKDRGDVYIRVLNPDDDFLFFARTREGDNLVSFTPRKEGRYVTAPQPSWLERSTWRPYLIMDLSPDALS
jgi:hypothetical protein